MRVMRVLTRPNVGGPTMQAIALWHAHRELGARTVLAVGTCLSSETAVDLRAHGIPQLDPRELGPSSEGFFVVDGLGNRRSPWAHRRARLVLCDAMRNVRPDVVHTHTSAAGFVGRRAAKAAGVQRTVHTFHGIVLRDYFSPLVSWALLRLEARLAQSTSALVAVSPSCRAELVELGVAKEDRIAVVPPAVPLPDFLPRAEARRRLGLPLDAFVVAAYGRLVPIKRTEAFLQALAAMPDARGDVHGDGPRMSSLVRIAPSNVTFRSASADARACMAAYDALVLPSRREGCPLVAIEAFAAGVPVVGFDVPGVCDALGPWGSGILVPESHGSEGLASALRSLRASPERGVAIAHRAKEHLPQFAPAAVAAQLLRLYESLPARAADS